MAGPAEKLNTCVQKMRQRGGYEGIRSSMYPCGCCWLLGTVLLLLLGTVLSPRTPNMMCMCCWAQGRKLLPAAAAGDQSGLLLCCMWCRGSASQPHEAFRQPLQVHPTRSAHPAVLHGGRLRFAGCCGNGLCGDRERLDLAPSTQRPLMFRRIPAVGQGAGRLHSIGKDAIRFCVLLSGKVTKKSATAPEKFEVYSGVMLEGSEQPI